jgi:hypothetical protein
MTTRTNTASTATINRYYHIIVIKFAYPCLLFAQFMYSQITY